MNPKQTYLPDNLEGKLALWPAPSATSFPNQDASEAESASADQANAPTQPVEETQEHPDGKRPGRVPLPRPLPQPGRPE